MTAGPPLPSAADRAGAGSSAAAAVAAEARRKSRRLILSMTGNSSIGSQAGAREAWAGSITIQPPRERGREGRAPTDGPPGSGFGGATLKEVQAPPRQKDG